MNRKYFSLLSAIALLAIACSKDSNHSSTDPNTPASGSQVQSVTSFIDYLPGTITQIDSFVYDKNNRLAKLICIGAGTGLGRPAYRDSTTYTFFLSGTDTVPKRVTADGNANSSLHFPVEFNLTYNDQDQLISDSNSLGFVHHYFYSDNQISFDTYVPAIGNDSGYSVQNHFLDTVILAGGNRIKTRSTILSGTSLHGQPGPQPFGTPIDFSFTNIVNPSAVPPNQAGFGMFLINQFVQELQADDNFDDFVSQNLRTSAFSDLNPAPPSYSLTWQTDSLGRPTEGIKRAPDDNPDIFEKITFRFKD